MAAGSAGLEVIGLAAAGQREQAHAPTQARVRVLLLFLVPLLVLVGALGRLVGGLAGRCGAALFAGDDQLLARLDLVASRDAVGLAELLDRDVVALSDAAERLAVPHHVGAFVGAGRCRRKQQGETEEQCRKAHRTTASMGPGPATNARLNVSGPWAEPVQDTSKSAKTKPSRSTTSPG